MSLSQMDAATSEMLRQMIRKEKEYYSGLKENEAFVSIVAQRLKHGGLVEKLLENNEKMQEYREAVKALADRNVRQERRVKSYVEGLKQLSGANTVDFSKQLNEAMSSALHQIEKDSVEIYQESSYLNVLNQLGERNTQGNKGDDDDDIVFMENDQGGGANLKCPMTSVLMKEPYRNRICGHVYEHAAILGHIRTATYKSCPVAGCNNRHLSESQLEPDMVTANLIRRERVRQEHAQKQLQATQDAIEFDED